MKVVCSCGRPIGSKVFRQHARKCIVQLAVWSRDQRHMPILDERRVKPAGCTCDARMCAVCLALADERSVA